MKLRNYNNSVLVRYYFERDKNGCMRTERRKEMFNLCELTFNETGFLLY